MNFVVLFLGLLPALVFAIDCSTNQPNLSDETVLRRYVQQSDLVIVGTLLDLKRKKTSFGYFKGDAAGQQVAMGRKGRVLIRRVLAGRQFLSKRFNELSTTARIQSQIPTIILGSDTEDIIGKSSKVNSTSKSNVSEDFATYVRDGLLSVQGFHSNVVCNSAVERFDTRIFLLKMLPRRKVSGRKRNKAKWRVLVSPISLNWRSIEKIERAIMKQREIQNATGHYLSNTKAPTKTTARPTLTTMPSCSSIECRRPGEICVIRQGVAKCECPRDCPKANGAIAGSGPTSVCGSDGTTYPSMCHLAKAQCINRNSQLRFKHTGSCDVPDPCIGTNCTLGAICERSLDGLTARCICPRQCPVSDVTGSKGTLCGSDGRDYPSLCQLRKSSCEAMRDIKPSRAGKCNPCEGVKCPVRSQRCIVDPTTRQPQCKCIDNCSDVPYVPVCATNGKTYSNICYLRLEACRLNMSISVYQPDVTSCRQTNIACVESSCSGPGEHCVVTGRHRKARCVCPYTREASLLKKSGKKSKSQVSHCPKFRDPVCGDDGITYANDCELRRKSCLSRRTVRIRFYAKCRDSSLCSSIRCHHGAKCSVYRESGLVVDEKYGNFSSVRKSPVVTCRCPEAECPYNYDPVCASDGKTYTNKCLMKASACRLQTNITEFHKGQCGGCEDLTCPFYGNCSIDAKTGYPQCVCPANCPLAQAVICGSDNRTYVNYCEMTVAACKLNMNITVKHEGYCDRCRSIKCPLGKICVYGECVCAPSCGNTNAPVCGSDGKTYQNECKLNLVACQTGLSNLTVSHRGKCKPTIIVPRNKPSYSNATCSLLNCRYGGNCELDITDGRIRCMCSNFTCLEIRDPVCASDGKLYGNICEMHKVACQVQKPITKVPLGECQNLEPLPCNGRHAPLTDAFGVEYDCLDSLTSICPDRSFCHRGPTFAVCCPEESKSDAIRLLPNRRRPTTAAIPLDIFLNNPGSLRPISARGRKARRRERKHIKQDIPSIKTLCESTNYGCCRDGVSMAHGPNYQGCPEWCQCDPIGSFGSVCSLPSGQCMCRPGVVGLKCDKCAPGFYSMSPVNHPRGCIACECDPRGTVVNATAKCDIDTGQCPCKPDATGLRCNRCTRLGHVMVQGKCQLPAATTPAVYEAGSDSSQQLCGGVLCRYGAICHLGKCSCEALNCTNQLRPVCASDSRSYANKCHMRLSGCRNGKRLRLISYGYCQDLEQKATFADGTRNYRPSIDKMEAPPLTECDRRLNFKCLHGGTCFIDAENVAKCLCPIGRTGHFCEQPSRNSSFKVSPTQISVRSTPTSDMATFSVSNYFVPSFSSKSYMKLKRVKHISSNITIEIELRALKTYGTILYIGQSDPSSAKKSNKRPPRGLKRRRKESKRERLNFVALVLRKRFVEFRLDFGQGVVRIRSCQPIVLKQFHVVTAHWSAEDGSAYIQLDNEKWQKTTLPSKKKKSLPKLNLSLPIVLGYIKGNDKKKSGLNERLGGVRNGFVGCLQSLRIVNSNGASKIYSLLSSSKDVLFGRDIKECGRSGACSDSPCLNGGTCVATQNASAGFTCACSKGYSGKRCEITSKCDNKTCLNGGSCRLLNQIYPVCKCPSTFTGTNCEIYKGKQSFVPMFTGKAFIERPPIGKLATHFRIEIWFLATQVNGVLLLATSKPYGKGDFIAVNLINGYIQAHIRHSTWIQQITSRDRIPLSVWTRLVVMRRKRDELILSINRRQTRTKLGRFVATSNLEMSPPGFTVENRQAKFQSVRRMPRAVPTAAPASDQAGILPKTPFTLPLPYFIGGYRHFYDVPAETTILHPFEGAIQRISIDGNVVNDILSGSLAMGGGIRRFTGPPCSGNPCKNGGKCQPLLANFRCNCPKTKEGDLCEFDKRKLTMLKEKGGAEALAVRFNGSTSLKFYNAIKRRERRQENNAFFMRIKTLSRDGTLVFIRKSLTASADFLLIALQDGYVMVAVNLGNLEPTFLRSNRRINDGGWHSIRFDRQKRLLSLIVDNEPEVTMFAAEGGTQLNSNGYLVVGGIDSKIKGLPSSYLQPFVGCMTPMKVDNATLQLYSGRRGSARFPLTFCSTRRSTSGTRRKKRKKIKVQLSNS